MFSLKLQNLPGPIRGRKLSTATAGPETRGPLMDRMDLGSMNLLSCSEPRPGSEGSVRKGRD